MNYYRNNIRNVKGDTYSSTLLIENLGQDVDSIYFTCRDSLNDNSEILFEKKLNDGISLIEYDEEKDIRKYAVRVAPNDTNNLQTGTYYYDLQVSVNGDVFTIMKGFFIVEQDATRKYLPPVDPELYIKIILDEINGEIIGTTVIDKTDYLSGTKEEIKDSLNNLGAGIDDEDTFRSYAASIDDLYDEWPKVTDEGTNITLSNTKKGKMTIRPKGNTEQTTYSGKNLFYLDTSISYGSGSGVTITKNNDGSYTLNGTSTGGATFFRGIRVLNETHSLSYTSNKTSSGVYVRTRDSEITVNGQIQDQLECSALNRSISSSKEIKYVEISISSGTVLNDFTIYPQIEASSTATDFEPYVGGVPSPNPDYPQDIKVVKGNNTITIGDGTNSEDYSINLGSIELCKIGDYQDYIYKENNKWYKHSEIGNTTFNNTTVLAILNNQSGADITSLNGTYAILKNNIDNNLTNNNMYCTLAKYEYSSTITGNSNAQTNLNDNTFCMRQGTNDRVYFKNSSFTGKTGVQISNEINGKKIYYVLATPTTTQITDTDLIEQLEALFMSYNTTTNISSTYTTGNAPMIINASALMKGSE